MNPLVVSRILRAAAWLLGPALGGMVVATEPAPAAGATLRLDTVMVTTTSDYRLLEEGWQVGEVPGFRLFSHGNQAVQSVADQLQLARAAFGLVWNDEALLRRPLTVVVTADETEFLAWANLPPLAMDRTVRVIDTPTGAVLLVNGGHETVQHAVGRGYVMAQLRGTKLPRWLQEGIAQVVNSAEATGDRLQVGRIQPDARNALPLETLRNLRGNMVFAPTRGVSQLDQVGGIVNRRGDGVEVRLDGMIPTWQELEGHLDGELQRRIDERYTYTPTSDFLSFLADGVVMDLDRVFDPAAPDTVAWRMNAWGFTHYSLFADKQGHRAQFLKFVQQLGREPGRAPVEVLREVYGMSAGKLELNLSLYARKGSYDIFDYKLAEPFRAVPAALASVPEANVLQLRARVLVATGRDEAARQVLTHGYANPANRSAAYVSQLAALELATRPERAGELLEDAARREKLDNSGRRMLAGLRLERLQRDGARLATNDLRMVLLPLFAALEQGDQSEELFVLIGRAWAASAVPPKAEHLNALRLGLSYHPGSRVIGELLQQLERAS